MIIGRIALGALLAALAAFGARAETRLVTFEAAEARGAIWEIISTLPGCSISAPRGSGGAYSALVDVDCRAYARPAGRPAVAGNVIRLFSRMILEPPWFVQGASASYAPSSGGAAAIVTIIRPATGAAGNTRNAWIELQMNPSGPTEGTIRVSLTAARLVTPIPPPIVDCRRSYGRSLFFCSSNADCQSGFVCAPECANTCRE